ncbi:MAG: hypothetical protein GX220_01405 [Treponema sp.]|jgi:hypothetical protein|nr:hypothetical protein [Treponema sp.]
MKAMNLYDAYNKNMLPKDEGYIVSGFFLPDTPYSIFEVVSYAEVKSFHATNESMTFQTDGKKMYVLVEPASYNQKSTEPYLRPSKYQIPLRFNALNVHTCKNQYKIMYSKEPLYVMTSFTVLKPVGMNFSFIVFPGEQMRATISTLFEKSFYDQANVPLVDSKKVADEIAELVVKEMSFPNKKKSGEPLETVNKEKLKGK